MTMPLAASNEPRISAMAQKILDVLADAPYGTRFDYAAFRRIIFEDPQSRRGRAAILQAKQRLLKEYTKLLLNVRNKGYEVVHPREQRSESKRLETHARRRFRRALDVVVYCEEEQLTPQERQHNQEQGLRLRLLLAVARNVAKATLQPGTPQAGPAIVVPTGRELAALLQAKPAD